MNVGFYINYFTKRLASLGHLYNIVSYINYKLIVVFVPLLINLRSTGIYYDIVEYQKW